MKISRYDDHKKPIEEPAKGSSSHTLDTGDDGFLSLVSEDPNREYARAFLAFNNDEILDIKEADKFLCTGCLNRMMSENWGGGPYGIEIIDFRTEDVRPLGPDIMVFIFNDYYITYDLREKREEDSDVEMDLLASYCPERYERWMVWEYFH